MFEKLILTHDANTVRRKKYMNYLKIKREVLNTSRNR